MSGCNALRRPRPPSRSSPLSRAEAGDQLPRTLALLDEMAADIKGKAEVSRPMPRDWRHVTMAARAGRPPASHP